MHGFVVHACKVAAASSCTWSHPLQWIYLLIKSYASIHQWTAAGLKIVSTHLWTDDGQQSRTTVALAQVLITWMNICSMVALVLHQVWITLLLSVYLVEFVG